MTDRWLMFTKDSEKYDPPMGVPIPHGPETEIRDINIKFDDKGITEIRWTDKEGKEYGPNVPIPEGANDWYDTDDWDGDVPEQIFEPPKGANDWHAKFDEDGKVKSGYWTKDGEPIPPDITTTKSLHFRIPKSPSIQKK